MGDADAGRSIAKTFVMIVDDVDAADEPREDARAAGEGGRVAATAFATCISRAWKGDARRFSTFRPVRVGAAQVLSWRSRSV